MAKNKKAQILAAVMCAATVAGVSPAISSATPIYADGKQVADYEVAEDGLELTVGGHTIAFRNDKNSTPGFNVWANQTISGDVLVKGKDHNLTVDGTFTAGGNTFKVDAYTGVTTLKATDVHGNLITYDLNKKLSDIDGIERFADGKQHEITSIEGNTFSDKGDITSASGKFSVDQSGALSAADGKFYVGQGGSVSAANGKLKIDRYTGNLTTEGDLRTTDYSLNTLGATTDGIERVDANEDGVADTTIIEGQTTISDDGKFTTANKRFSVNQQGDIRTRNDANGDWTFEVDSATGDINTQGKVIANGANINGEFNANNGHAIISTNGDNVYVSTSKGFLNVTGDSTVLGHGSSTLNLTGDNTVLSYGSNTVTLDGNGATFYTGDASKGATTIMGGTISTNKLLVGGVDVAGTAVDVADRVQDITHGGTADDHWTKVENTFFNSDGSMNTANGNFIVTKEGKAQSTQDFVIMGENNTALYSLKDIGYTTSEIQYNTQHITHSNIDGVDWTKVEGVYFNADGSMNVGNGNFIVLNDGTVDSLKDIKTKADIITLDENGNTKYSLNTIGDKVAGLEENGAGISNGNFQVAENGSVTNTIKDENNKTVSEITTNENGLTVKDENGATTINGSGITVGTGTTITDGAITTGTGNFTNVNVSGELKVNGETLATTGFVDTLRKDIGDLTELDLDIQDENLVGAVNKVNGKVDAVDAKVGDTSKLDSDLAVNGDKTSLVEAINAEANLRQGVANRVSGLESRVGSLEDRMGDVEDRIDKVGAMAAAIANLRTMGYDPEAPTEIAVGVGQYESETGLALGVFHYPNQDFMLSASISTSGDEVMGGIGATWKIGRKSSAEKARSVEEKRVAKAEEMQEMAKAEKVKAQRERHAQMLAEREAAK